MSHLRLQGARPRRRRRRKGEVEADDKQAVAAQLRSQGPDRPRHRGAEAADAGDLLARFKRVKADDLDDRHPPALDDGLVGHVAAARALRARGADRERQAASEALVDVRKDVEAGICALATRSRATPKSSTSSTWRWWRAGETGGILEETLLRVADQLEKDDALRRQVKAAMIYPIADRRLRADRAARARRLPRARSSRSIFKDFGGELPGDHEVHRLAVAPHHAAAGTS